ncbi:MAG TPA: zinc-dependent metalloprotease [Roseiflexaceae bacterium]|nr:zinc-dependent metalloprotease [Roseiflexaceae bacterium]
MPQPPNHGLRRLGAILLLGIVAGAGLRYLTARAAAMPGRPSRLIDWEQARRFALRVSQWEQAPIPDRQARRQQYLRLVERSEPLIAAYIGQPLPESITRVHVYDRREWLEANFASFAVVFQPIEELYADVSSRQGVLGSALGQLNSQLLGAQMGVLLGFLARRVLGQYDLSLLSPDPAVRGALYFVEPNIGRVQRQLGLPDEDFRLWIALHEATHVFEFEAFPWVREYFNDLLRQFLAQLGNQLSSLGVSLPRLVDRLLRGQTQGRHWIELMLTPEQQRVFDKIQALMSLVEGYSNHIMNAIGRQLLPSYDLIEQRVKARQLNRPLLEELFNRITGMDLKLAQYQQGEAFVNAVVAARGVAFVNRVWQHPEHLPTMAEIREPQRWIERMGG